MRISWIDNAKAIAMILIVIGHTKISSDLFSLYANGYKLPIFFFIAGFLFKSKYINDGIFIYIKRQFKLTMVPYLTFWVISYIYWLPTNIFKNSQGLPVKSAIYEPFIGLLYGINTSIPSNVALWFFPCIFVTMVMFCLVYKYIDKLPWLTFSIIMTVGLSVAYFYNKPQIRLPWNIDIAFVALIFYSLGFILRNKMIINKILFNSRIYNVAVSAVLLIIVGELNKLNGPIQMVGHFYGNPLLFLIFSIVGIVAIIYLSEAIPKNIVSEWISKNTIFIFPLHQLIFSVFTGIGVIIFNLPYGFKEHLIYIILYVAGSIFMCIPISFIFRKYAPALIGAR